MRPHRPTILLFDIDGTLVWTGGAGRRAIERAFDQLFGRKDVCSHFSFGGMTDRAIIREGCRALGHVDDPRVEAHIEALIDHYLTYLEEEVAVSPKFEILPGVPELLTRLEGRPGLALGLGTGNVKRGAKIKLARGGLDHHFHFGGFGCDHEDRAEIIRTGMRRGAEALGEPLERCRSVVIGDTPKDVHAAKAAGAECVGVGTGGHAPQALIELGADFAFPDMTAPAMLEVLLGSARR